MSEIGYVTAMLGLEGTHSTVWAVDLDVQEQRAVSNLVGSVKAEIALRIAAFRVGLVAAVPEADGPEVC
jgi:hypothetical protein